MVESGAIEKRIADIEEWKTTLKNYWRLAVFGVTLAGIMFQWQSCKINERIALLDKQISQRESKLAKIDALAKAAEQTANSAMMCAGNLQEVVGTSQRASFQAAESSKESRLALTEIKVALGRIEESITKAESWSQKAMASSETTRALVVDIQEAVKIANGAANKAEAIATEVEKKFRLLDVALSEATAHLKATQEKVIAQIQSEVKIPTRDANDNRIIEISVSGMNSKVTLREGITSLRRVKLSSMNYVGTVYIPKGFSAIVTCTAIETTIFIAPELKGRVTVNSSGMGSQVVEMK